MNKVLIVLLDLLFLIVFNIIFFTTVGINAAVSIWISYGFIHFAYIMLLLTPLFLKKKIDTNFFGLPIIAVSAVYFIIELLLDGALIFTGAFTAIPIFLINLVVTGIYLAILITAVLTTDSVSRNAQRHKTERYYIETNSNNLLLIRTMVNDKELLKKIDKAYDIISSSPAKSSSKVYSIENDIEQKVESLRAEITNGNLSDTETKINTIIELAKKRNLVLKSNIL